LEGTLLSCSGLLTYGKENIVHTYQ
jgi:hypothetical protein